MDVLSDAGGFACEGKELQVSCSAFGHYLVKQEKQREVSYLIEGLPGLRRDVPFFFSPEHDGIDQGFWFLP